MVQFQVAVDNLSWLNDKHEAVAWHIETVAGHKDKGFVYYKNGTYEKISKSFSPSVGTDPSGKYFIKDPSSNSSNIPLSNRCKTEIYSVEKPDLPLASIRCCVERLYSKDGNIYLFGRDYDEKNNKVSDSITMYVFQIIDIGLRKIETKIIEPTLEGMSVEDFSPWDEKVLLVKYYDPPFSRSVFYEFDLQTKEMKKIGSGGRGFYLQCDIINEVSKKRREIDSGFLPH